MDAAQDVQAAKGIRAMPTFHLYFRGKVQEQWSGADLPRLTAAIDRLGATVDEILTAEAVALSLEGEGGGGGGSGAPAPAPASAPAGSGSGSGSGSGAGASSSEGDEEVDPELAEALRLSMM